MGEWRLLQVGEVRTGHCKSDHKLRPEEYAEIQPRKDLGRKNFWAKDTAAEMSLAKSREC